MSDDCADKSEECDALFEWSLEDHPSRDECACCWIPARQAAFHRWPGLQAHHLVKRSRRVCHERWNLLRLCRRCHDLAELHQIRECGVLLPKLAFGICLTLKREQAIADARRLGTDEYGEWQPRLLAELYGRTLPDLEPLPQVFADERCRWKPFVPWRYLIPSATL